MRKGLHKTETHHIFMALGIGSLMLFPVLLLIIPWSMANNLHETSSSLFVEVPKAIYYSYGLGFVLLSFTFFLLLFLQVSNKSKLISVVPVLLAVFCFVNGSQQFMRVAAESITFKKSVISEEFHYSWDDVEKVVFREQPKEGGFPKFDFYFKDGNKLTLPESVKVRQWRNWLEAKFKQEDIEFRRGASKLNNG